MDFNITKHSWKISPTGSINIELNISFNGLHDFEKKKRKTLPHMTLYSSMFSKAGTLVLNLNAGP